MKYDTLRHKTEYNAKKYFEKKSKKIFWKKNNFVVPVFFQQIARLLVRENQAILEKNGTENLPYKQISDFFSTFGIMTDHNLARDTPFMEFDHSKWPVKPPLSAPPKIMPH